MGRGVIVGRLVAETEGIGLTVGRAVEEAEGNRARVGWAVGDKSIGGTGVTVGMEGDAGDSPTRQKPITAQRVPASPRAIRIYAALLNRTGEGTFTALTPNLFPAVFVSHSNQVMAWIIYGSPLLVKR